MEGRELKLKNLLSECKFQASRSQGPGGQNVNKLNTRMELRFSVDNSRYLSEEEKILIKQKWKNRISNESILYLTEQSSRSRLKNQTELESRFKLLIAKALEKPKKRIPTKATKASREKRIEKKKILSEKKKLRQNPDY